MRARPAHVPLIVGLGGGWNSTAALIELYRRNLPPDLIVFADTRGEKPGTMAHLAEMRDWCRGVGFPPMLVVVNGSPRAGYVSLEDECLRKHTLPSRVFGGSSCAQKWKHDPMDKHLTSWPHAQACWYMGDKPIKLIGYDEGEESRASVLEDKRLRYWYPLREWGWDREECRDAILREGLTLPPKSACFYCPSSTKEEVLWLSVAHPDLFARAVAMEDNASPENTRNVRGLGRAWSWADLVAADPAVRAAWPESPVERCMTCHVDGGCEVEELFTLAIQEAP